MTTAGAMVTALVAGKPRTAELIKLNARTCLVRLPGQRAAIIKRHLRKHHVTLADWTSR